MENEILANDLMVGDWVYAKTEKGKKIAKVCWRSDKFAAAEATDGSEYTGKQFDGVFSCIEPIPLTPEILEKNGIIKTYEDDEYAVYKGEGFNVTEYYTELWEFSARRNRIIFKNVHQLQHALRLAGIEKEIEL